MPVTGQFGGSLHYLWSSGDIVGKGATGEVYRCRDKDNGDIFAVRCLNSGSDTKHKDVFFDLQRKLVHPNVIKTVAIEEEIYTGGLVLIMEYCNGGSLYECLKEPECYFGEPEDEFLIILRNIADGLEYLNRNGVNMRYVTPMDTMRVITADKRHVYKLRAHNLKEKEKDDLKRTLETNERAVKTQGHASHFGESVDMLSLGKTLYQIATGQLPLAFMSDVQDSEEEAVMWNGELPSTCLLSRSLRSLLTPLIDGLLEVDPKKRCSFKIFLEMARSITETRVVHVFNSHRSTLLRIYLKETADRLAHCQELLAELTGISKSNQILLFDYQELTKTSSAQVRSSFPKTTEENPVLLLSNDSTCLPTEQFRNEIPQFIGFARTSSAANDVTLARQCSALICLLQRCALMYTSLQQLVQLSVKQYLCQLLNKVKQIEQSLNHIRLDDCHSRITCLMKSIKLQERLAKLYESVIRFPRDHMDACMKAKTGVEKLQQEHLDLYQSVEEFSSKNNEVMKQWEPGFGCSQDDRCNSKMRHLVERAKQLVQDLKNDSLKDLGGYEKELHEKKKHDMQNLYYQSLELCNEHCLPNLWKVSERFISWYRISNRDIFLLAKQHKLLQESLQNKNQFIEQTQQQYGEYVEKLILDLEMNSLNVADSKPDQISYEGQQDDIKKDIESQKLELDLLKLMCRIEKGFCCPVFLDACSKLKLSSGTLLVYLRRHVKGEVLKGLQEAAKNEVANSRIFLEIYQTADVIGEAALNEIKEFLIAEIIDAMEMTCY